MLYSGHFHKSGNLTIFKTAARERNNIIIVKFPFVACKTSDIMLN